MIILLTIFVTILIALFCYYLYILYKHFHEEKPKNKIYHIMIVMKKCAAKPHFPKKKKDETLIILNQGSYTFHPETKHKEFEFPISNAELSEAEIRELAKELIPRDAETHYYIF
jgi:hypothetical protein